MGHLSIHFADWVASHVAGPPALKWSLSFLGTCCGHLSGEEEVKMEEDEKEKALKYC